MRGDNFVAVHQHRAVGVCIAAPACEGERCARAGFQMDDASGAVGSAAIAIRLRIDSDATSRVAIGFDRQRVADLRSLAGGVGNIDLVRSEEHTSELQSPYDLVCRLLLEKKKIDNNSIIVCLVIYIILSTVFFLM